MRKKAKQRIGTLLLAIMVTLSFIPVSAFQQEVYAANGSSGKVWGTDVTDAKLNQKNNTNMACTEYLEWALESFYGVSIAGGNVSAVHSQLESLVSQGLATRVINGASHVYNSQVKPGDIVVCNTGHVAIVGEGSDSKGNPKALHHGGLGSTTQSAFGMSGSVGWAYSIEGLEYIDNSTSHFDAPFYVYRILSDKGYLKLSKSIGENKTVATNSDCSSNYSIAGAVYTVYSGSTVVGRFVTDASGVGHVGSASGSTTMELDPGTYTVKETAVPDGYAYDTQSYSVTIQSDVTSTVKSTDNALVDPFTIKIQKKFSEEHEDDESGYHTLKNAVYSVKYFADPDLSESEAIAKAEAGEATRTWYFVTDSSGAIKLDKDYLAPETFTDAQGDSHTLKSDAFFYDDNGDECGPVGTYVFTEEIAPKGLTLDEDSPYVASYKVVDGKIIEQIGDLVSEGAADETLFSIENDQKIEIKVAKENAGTDYDETTYIGSLAGAEYRVEYDDPDLRDPLYVGTITTDADGNGSLTEAEADSAYAKSNGFTRLRSGTYTVTEVTASPGFLLDAETYELKAKFNEVNTAVFTYTAKSKETPKILKIAKVDESGDPLEGATLALYNEAGEELDRWTTTTEPRIIEAPPAGTYTVKELDAPYGYETGEDVTITVNDDEQELYTVSYENVPIEIKTTAKSEETDTNVGVAGEEETLIDTVAYENLVVGRTYTMTGTLMDKETGEPLLDADGNEITASKEFTAEATSGTVELTFTYDSSLLKGKSTVVFEDLYKNGKEIATHSDINDEDQTIHYPEIGTSAGLTGIGESTAAITDIVSYKNLPAGKVYTLKGILMDKDTGEPFLVDGKEVTGEVSFTPGSLTGTVNVSFAVPAEALADKTVVVFEELYYEDKLLTSHQDIEDKNQTVSVGVLDVEGPEDGGFPLIQSSTPKTGDPASFVFAFVLFLVALVSLRLIHMARKRESEESA